MPRSPLDPGLEAELDAIARHLREELGGASAAPPPVRSRPARGGVGSHAVVARFLVATVLPGLVLIGVTLVMGLNG